MNVGGCGKSWNISIVADAIDGSLLAIEISSSRVKLYKNTGNTEDCEAEDRATK